MKATEHCGDSIRPNRFIHVRDRPEPALTVGAAFVVETLGGLFLDLPIVDEVLRAPRAAVVRNPQLPFVLPRDCTYGLADVRVEAGSEGV